ncbi:cysteine desulfurase [bacterium]|nr:MAG: cysteine desulfurase [bacterium]
MLDPARYFDHAATTPLAPEVLKEMEPFLGLPANAGSIHAFGRRAMDAVERARARVAEAVGAEDPAQIVFTSGATEACNTVLNAHDGGWISPFEHAAVREPAIARGYRVLPNEELTLRPDPKGEGLLAVMAVNNEIGAQWEARDLPAQSRFVDATQALGKVALNLDEIDYAAFSAHKLYGPQGIGALFTASGSMEPLLRGGEQEEGRRAGTQNVAGIVGFGAACALAQDRLEEDDAHVTELRWTLIQELLASNLTDWRIIAPETSVPHILSISFFGVEGETLVIEADHAGFAISAGAACSSRSTEPSHVLTALGLEEQWRRGTVRISFGRGNTKETVAALGKTLVRSTENLRTIA